MQEVMTSAFNKCGVRNEDYRGNEYSKAMAAHVCHTRWERNGRDRNLDWYPILVLRAERVYGSEALLLSKSNHLGRKRLASAAHVELHVCGLYLLTSDLGLKLVVGRARVWPYRFIKNNNGKPT